jgi:hypothetical protein
MIKPQHSETLTLIETFLAHDEALALVKASIAAQSPVAVVENQQQQRQLRRARADADPLQHDFVLDHVFSFVGSREYIYTAAVCRRWRGRYLTLSYKQAAGKPQKLQTSYRSSVVTAARLRLAMQSGLDMKTLSADTEEFARDVVEHSLEPTAVLAVAKIFDLKWSPALCHWAAAKCKLELLQWLHLHKCPWELEEVARCTAQSGLIPALEWLQETTAPWSDDLKASMLWCAGCCRCLDAVKWFRKAGAAWPASFCGTLPFEGREFNDCWSAAIVRYALANGCGWGNWQCQQLEPARYSCACADWPGKHNDNREYNSAVADDDERYYRCDREQAQALFKWAHKNGCPCTCDAAQAAAASAASAAAAAALAPLTAALAALAPPPPAAAAVAQL